MTKIIKELWAWATECWEQPMGHVGGYIFVLILALAVLILCLNFPGTVLVFAAGYLTHEVLK